ncbi:reverse transcriptase domain-containing protein [Tanacetum coccineum]
MKRLITELPTLTAPKREEELMVYLSAANEAVSAVLLVERHGRQAPIHYVSRTLQGAEINYQPMEKLILALVHAVKQLRRYFQGHIIKVITDKPISQILNNREATGRLARWGIELEAYGIKYASRSVIKGQVLADFLADTMAEDSSTQVKACGPNDTLTKGKSREEQEAPETKTPKNLGTKTDIWKLYTDRASNEHGSGAGLIRIDPKGAEYSYALRLNFANLNNNAEYEAMLAKYLIKEIHTGSCGMHDEPRRVVHKAMNAGYFWPSMHQDTNNEVSSCDSCQVYATISKLPKNDMISVTSAWPFQKWEMDIVGPLPEAPGRIKTTPKISNGKTPFSLAYGTEAVIPAEIDIPTRRTIQRSDEENKEALRMNLNLLEERKRDSDNQRNKTKTTSGKVLQSTSPS